LVKAYHHSGVLPWKEVAISGWGLAPGGTEKISKSRGGGPLAPREMIERYSADAVRYWAASTGFGKDATISEEKIQAGARLVTKLWNVASFSQRFLEGYRPPERLPTLSTADRWILSRAQRLIERVTNLFRSYDYAAARSETESFFWRDLADNYVEMAKGRLYNEASGGYDGARYALFHVLLTLVKLFAPLLPHVTEAIYQGLFAAFEGHESVHRARWPAANAALLDDLAEAAGETLVEIATAVRRYKSEQSLSLSTELARLQLATEEATLANALEEAIDDLRSITRARQIALSARLDSRLEEVKTDGTISIALARV
ncbi:MAG TPA: class I tRNA ligase family protein, partial [Ktedonobacterales bacterium]